MLHGATPSPFDALNALRGIRTLAVRTTHQAATRAVPRRVARSGTRPCRPCTTPACTRTRSTTSPSARCASSARCLAFELAGGVDRPPSSSSTTVQLLRVATSLGGPETLVCHPATTTHASLTPEEAVAQGVTAGLLRVSVGLEDPADLLADFHHALAG